MITNFISFSCRKHEAVSRNNGDLVHKAVGFEPSNFLQNHNHHDEKIIERLIDPFLTIYSNTIRQKYSKKLKKRQSQHIRKQRRYLELFCCHTSSSAVHTILKVKFLSKNSILKKPQALNIFTSFSPKIFFDNFSCEIKVANS